MHTIKLQVEDTVYNEIVQSGINIQDELKKTLHKLLYSKEHKIADDINQSLNDMNQGKSRPVSELFSEI